MSLFNETGHASQDDRNAEAERLIEELVANLEPLTQVERSFVESMNQRTYEGNLHCSAKQLFWLRDLYEKYCL